MKTRFTSATLLAAVTVLGLGVAPAFAADANANSGYVYPDFWGDEAAQQQVPSATAPVHTDGAPIGAYVTNSSHGTWLFPPNPNAGGTNG
jgi:hypothetical protein